VHQVGHYPEPEPQHISLDITLPILKCLQVKIPKYIKKIDKYENYNIVIIKLHDREYFQE
jgi:hypothetical protein